MTTLSYKDYIYYSIDMLEKKKKDNEYKVQKLKKELNEVLESNKLLRDKVKILEGYIKFMGGSKSNEDK